MKFGVTNLRRLRNVAPIDIKPITLLVGKNSGGKSSFLRSFPLFRQSLLTRTSSPILWFGDLVDFGSFDASVSRFNKADEVTFTFSASGIGFEEQEYYYFIDDFPVVQRSSQKARLISASFTPTIVRRQEKNRLSILEYHVSDKDIKVKIQMTDEGLVQEIYINGVESSKFLEGAKMVSSGASLFPELRIIPNKEQVPVGAPWRHLSSSALVAPLFKILRQNIDGRVRDPSLQELARRMISSGFPDTEALLAVARSSGKMVGERMRYMLLQNSNLRDRIFTTITLSNIPLLSRSIGNHFKPILSSVLYIGPARARSERYYRYQDLAVDEIDPDGQNFAMFLNSLSRSKLEAFSNWVESLFGYGVSVTQKTGHISISLIDRGIETNIVDVGYGVSQVLPVLGQIWWARERTSPRARNASISILAIEQPELHLHPAHQALLADALVEEAKASRARNTNARTIHYLIETHSETLVNRLGEFIAAGRLSPDDVQVVLFEPSEDGLMTDVRVVPFDNNGSLVNWPFGFFQPPVI
ncbi:AAA family ATPase [Fertoebacter nigrum]|uniref:AAA family ATPase n=1 Tax=Fertoeibacter niger TaxID=2656921 RepID=A0A8X8KNH7_9RHOB|nr:AAA family ATPase [Fertoeibacter niger]NUB43806.1 AAA family ATPase [Fertoeibacter niger]